jgi:predicted metal-dependent hydrolase
MPYIAYKDSIITYNLIRKSVKNINFHINPDGLLCVSAPKRLDLNYIEKAVTEKADWVKKWQDKIKANPVRESNTLLENGGHIWFNGIKYGLHIAIAQEEKIEVLNTVIKINIKLENIDNQIHIKKIYNEWLRDNAIITFTNVTKKYHDRLQNYHIPFPSIQIRSMKSRWGTCIPNKNKIILNLNLINTPIKCIEYVVLHELAHFKYNNHSKKFYDFVENAMPDWKSRKELLDMKYGFVI